LALGTRLITCGTFLDDTDRLILAGKDGCHSFFFEYGCKHPPTKNLTLNPKGEDMSFKLIKDPEVPESLPWCKGLRFGQVPGDYILTVWNPRQVSIYSPFVWTETEEVFGNLNMKKEVTKVKMKLDFSYRQLINEED
jgi:WD40 repeat protein